MLPSVTFRQMTRHQLRQLRARLTMTRAELASVLGVSRVTVHRWEVGDLAIPEPTARLIELVAAEGAPKKKR
jgi:DNA-binding transcriptional regulator YiaG